MYAASPNLDTILNSTGRSFRKGCGPQRSATCICESSGACVIHDAIRRTWAGATLHFGALLMIFARQQRSTLMCAEAVPWRCHRSLIADALTVRGVHVEDILSKNRTQAHSLIPFARVQGYRIIYPVPNGGDGRVLQLNRIPKSLRKIQKTKI